VSLDALLAAEQLPEEFRRTIADVCEPLAERIASLPRAQDRCLTVGLCGAQGSGKSTVTRVIKLLLQGRGLRTVCLSLDDFYLTRAARQVLAGSVHPLLQTRGVPGTHDVPLLNETFDALRAGRTTPLPVFDKATDDRVARARWSTASAGTQIILFEGWCVGAVPQATHDLLVPINSLEQEQDAQGIWRRFVNEALDSDYRRLFAGVDWLILLAAPDFQVVCEWRLQQEEKLRWRVMRDGGDLTRLMTEPQIRHFIAHYERLTRHMLSEMPDRVDACVWLDDVRRAIDVRLS
jgi:D-glycerate 3-kinase